MCALRLGLLGERLLSSTECSRDGGQSEYLYRDGWLTVARWMFFEHRNRGEIGPTVMAQSARRSSASAHAAGPQETRFKKTNAQLNLHTKLLICAAMVITQSATMLHVTIEGYGRRDWVHETMTVVGLTCAWIYFSYEAVLIFADTYTRGFIALAIKEQKVIYNISWEDPRVEREELKLSSDDVVLTISSAGCNVLDYLLEKPKHITAVDLNEAQLAVLDLKLACVAAKMPQHDFFALWGCHPV